MELNGMIRIVVPCIGIKLLMLSTVEHCIAYDKHSCAMHWIEIANDDHCCAMHMDCAAYVKHSCALHMDCAAYDKHSSAMHGN